MLNGYIITSLLIAFAFVVLGLATLARNSKSRQNKYFFIYSFSLAIWLVANYLAGDLAVPQSIALWANKFVFLFGGLGILFLLLFTKSLTQRKFNWFEKLIVRVSPFILLASLAPLVVGGVYPQGNTYAINFGILSAPYFFILLATLTLTIVDLVKARHHASGILRSQVDVILASFAVGVTAIVITNALLPFLFNYYGLAQVGSFFSIFFVVGLAYAIIKHRLFDIRLVVARTLAYLLSWVVLTFVYVFVLVSASSLLFGTKIEINTELFVYILIGLTLATGLVPLKRFFDKVTNRLFYRDAYEPQELLDEFNKNLVSVIQINKLLKNSATILEKNLKAEFVAFGLKETENSPQRVISNHQLNYSSEDIELVRSITPKISEKIIIADYLEDSQSQLKEVLVRNNIAALVRLVNNPHNGKEGIGYIILGNKKSGNPYGSQDVRILEIIANELVIAIQNALRFEEIEKFNITLQEKVDDATRRLRATNEKLKALDETKDEFISMASHQLRTPLTSVKGYLSMVLEGDAGELGDTQRKMLSQAFTSSQRMVYLIADLLNVSRLRTGKFVIEAVPTNLADAVQGEIEQLQETAASRSLELVYDKPENFPTLMLDETKIRQVIMNFTDNAIYYTPSGGRIEVKLEDKGKTIEFTVNDNGIGVPKHERPHLFGKFYRAGNARNARPDGTGLGLFMAKKVVIAQGGSIIFKSQEGKGSTFGFTFEKSKLLPKAQSSTTDTT